MSRFSISPGQIQKGTSPGFFELYSNEPNVVYAPFTVTQTSTVFASISDLPWDIDLYLGRIDSKTGLPETTTVLNSSTNPGQESESLFLQLKPGEYWLGVRTNLGIKPTNDQLNQAFKWSLDARTFEESTNLSNDPLLSSQWHLYNTGIIGDPTFNRSWSAAPNADIRAPEAWKLARDASSIIVAIIDEGVDTNHPDLRSNLWNNLGETPGNGVDDDNNGYIDDIHGWNFPGETSNVESGIGHGTHVAGIVGAKGNNSLGVSGVAWDAQLMTLDVFNGTNGSARVEEAIKYAVNNGAKVINMSIGIGFKMSPKDFVDSIQERMKEAFQYAYDNDVFIAISAGNNATQWHDRNYWRNTGNSDIYAYSDASIAAAFGNIASVGASNAQDLRSDFSNYGHSVTIMAPGGDSSSVVVGVTERNQPVYLGINETQILSTMPVGMGEIDEDYGYMAGTSMAAPVIAGIAALIRAQDLSITAPETLAILRAGAKQNPRLEPYVDNGYQADLYGSLLLAQQWEGPNTLTQIDQDIAPIFNVSYLTSAQKLKGELTTSRDDRRRDIITGFYRVLDVDGTVLDSTGNQIRPGDKDYAYYALSPRNIADSISDLGIKKGVSKEIEYELTGSSYLAPYAKTKKDTWFAWSDANADNQEHFKILDANSFGIERTFGGGDKDFTDIVMSFNSYQIL
jgi:subtilisin family serine protease